MRTVREGEWIVNRTGKPNVIVITTDQQRYDTLSCSGNEVIRTPNLDKLAQEGVKFNRSYASSPVCMPSRGSIFTGRYPRIHGSWNVGVNLPENEYGLSHLFNDAGYSTAAIGKLHFTNMNVLKKKGEFGPVESVHRNKGYSPKEVEKFWRQFNGNYYGFKTFKSVLQHGNRTVGGGHYDLWLRDNHPEAVDLLESKHALQPLSGATESWKAAMPVELHNSQWIANETIAYLENQIKNEDQPFFLWVGFPDPHHPLNPPQPYCDLYDPDEIVLDIPNKGEFDSMPPHYKQIYEGVMIRKYDKKLQESMGFSNLAGVAGTVAGKYPYVDMPESHLREMTAHYYGLITMVDDQVGRILTALEQLKLNDDTIIVFNSDHGDLMGDHGLVFKGPFHYEGIIRVPTIFKWSKKFATGKSTDSLFSHVDILPTLAEACGLEIPKGVQGISQLPVLKGEKESCRTWALVEHREDVGGLQVKTMVTDQYKISYYVTKDYGELFDLYSDPKEYRNLWENPQFQNVKYELLQQILEVLCITEDPLPERTGYS